MTDLDGLLPRGAVPIAILDCLRILEHTDARARLLTAALPRLRFDD